MKTAILIATSAFLINGAYAQSATPSAPAAAPAPTPMTRSASEDMKLEKHIKDLHAKLHVTAPEEALWAPVAQAMRDNASEIDTAIGKRNALGANANAVDDLNAYATIAQAHADSVKKLSTAFTPLYASMSDDQKKTADTVFIHRAHSDSKSAATMK
jgi:periplasmic protein CpxP/Spy